MVQTLWRREPAFPALARAGHATCVCDGCLLVFGGRTKEHFFADVWAFQPSTRTWELLCDSWPDAAPRSYHSATPVGSEVWVLGGSGADEVQSTALVFDPRTRRWRQPQLRGDVALLHRTAHGACVHPGRPGCLLLQGGYGAPHSAGPPPTQDYSYLNDVVELNTRTGVVRSLSPAGAPPSPRAYHAFAAAGSCCLVLAGRAGSSKLVKGRQLVGAYDVAANKWLPPGVLTGELPPRSSLRAAACPGGVLVFGGAVDRGHKAADLHLLEVSPCGRLAWRRLPPGTDPAAAGDGETWPAARAAHAMETLGGRLYVLGGYGEDRQYTGDCWSVSLEVAGGSDAAPPATAAAQPDRGSGASQAPAPSQWREARRSRTAAAFATPAHPKRQRVAAAMPASEPPAWGPPPSPAGDLPVVVCSYPPAPAPCWPQQAAPLPPCAPQQQQQPQQPQPQPQPAPADRRLVDLQAAVQQQQVAAAAREQLITDLQLENSQLRSRCARWEAAAQERRAEAQGAEAAAARHTAQVAELQRQLAATAAERDAARAAATAAARGEEELAELRCQQRRERDARERDELERDRLIEALRREAAEARASLAAATENNATQARLLDAAREDLAREQRAASELRRVQAEERERFTRSLQEQNDLLTAAQAAQQAAGAMLEAERRAHREAQAELERQTTKAQADAQRARQAEEERGELQRRLDSAREEAARLTAEAERWRAGKAALATALAAAQKGLEGLP